VYERQAVAGEKLFFERYYDPASRRDRLLKALGLELVDAEIWGERNVWTDRFLTRAGRMRDLFAPLEPLLSIRFLHRLGSEQAQAPMPAFFTLRKESRLKPPCSRHQYLQNKNRRFSGAGSVGTKTARTVRLAEVIQVAVSWVTYLPPK
jgi:hypothetical protein